MEQKQRNNSKVIILAALALLFSLIVIIMLLVTLARYTSTTTGTGTVNVARWTDISFDGTSIESDTFTFDLSETKNVNNNVVSTQIAPGDAGSFEITFGPAEVAYSYGITVNNIDASTAGHPSIKFYNDPEMTVLLTPETSIPVSLSAALSGFTKTIYWQWEYDGGIDAEDTADGLANASLNFQINLTATQTPASEASTE